MDYIYLECERILKKHQTRDPCELLRRIGAVTVFSNEYPADGLKGYSSILNRAAYAVVNARLTESERRIVLGHEAAHLILHSDVILASRTKTMRDFNIYNSSGRHEREANSFLADFLVSDGDVLDAMAITESDYFSVAGELSLPPPLLAFKLFSMTKRGFDVRSPVDLESGFLARSSHRW